MAVSWHRIKTYAKVSGIALVLLLALVFMFSNLDRVTVKFLWYEVWQAPTYAFILVVAIGGIVLFLICRKLGGVLRDVRQLRSENRARRELVKEVKREVQIETTQPVKEPQKSEEKQE